MWQVAETDSQGSKQPCGTFPRLHTNTCYFRVNVSLFALGEKIREGKKKDQKQPRTGTECPSLQSRECQASKSPTQLVVCQCGCTCSRSILLSTGTRLTQTLKGWTKIKSWLLSLELRFSMTIFWQNYKNDEVNYFKYSIFVAKENWWTNFCIVVQLVTQQRWKNLQTKWSFTGRRGLCSPAAHSTATLERKIDLLIFFF